MTSPDFNVDSQIPPTVEDRLQGVADYMLRHEIEAVLVDGMLDNGHTFEGISFIGSTQEIAEIRFADSKPVEVDEEELERRLAVQGFFEEVVRPVQRAATIVYSEGSDLLDERFDVLPGFAS